MKLIFFLVVRGPKSWEFLVRLLADQRSNPSLVRWEDEASATFRLMQPGIIAQMWAKRSSDKPHLSYNNFARGLRWAVLLPSSGGSALYLVGYHAHCNLRRYPVDQSDKHVIYFYRYHYSTGALEPVSERQLVYRCGPSALQYLKELKEQSWRSNVPKHRALSRKDFRMTKRKRPRHWRLPCLSYPAGQLFTFLSIMLTTIRDMHNTAATLQLQPLTLSNTQKEVSFVCHMEHSPGDWIRVKYVHIEPQPGHMMQILGHMFEPQPGHLSPRTQVWTWRRLSNMAGGIVKVQDNNTIKFWVSWEYPLSFTTMIIVWVQSHSLQL